MFMNRFFSLLVVMALALVAALTVREALATSAVVSDAEKAQHAQAADAARWTAMGEYYTNAEAVQSRAQVADSARWIAMSDYYQAQALNLDRGRAADAARWTAMAEYYLRLDTASK